MTPDEEVAFLLVACSSPTLTAVIERSETMRAAMRRKLNEQLAAVDEVEEQVVKLLGAQLRKTPRPKKPR